MLYKGAISMTNCVLRCSWISLLLAVLVFPAFAQRTTGDISGDVTDASGAVVPNVSITAENVGTGQSRSATTTNSGSYRIPELPIGTYKVTATAAGFKTTVQNAQVVAGGVIHADFKLPVGETS